LSFIKNYLSNSLTVLSRLDKFNVDLIWNIVSFFLIGVIGISLNILILKYYDSSILGVFNEVYAIYILLSQVSTGGIHLSLQKYIPQYSNEKRKTDIILLSAILITFIISSSVTLISYLLRNIPGEILHSEDVTLGFALVIPGLIFFSLNKVMLSYLAGYRMMKSYAVFVTVRSFLMLIILILLIIYNAKGFTTPLILSGAEIILFIVLIIYTTRFWNFIYSRQIFYWFKNHLRFGSKAVIGNILFDCNSRIDVLILGFYTSENSVGIYSFASMLSDGFTQFPIVLRTNINPILTKCYFSKGKFVLERIIKRSKKIFDKMVIPAGVVSIICFPILIRIFELQEKLSGGWIVFSILMFGIILSAGYLPFQLIFNQLGFPGIQSLFLFLYFLTNVVLNIILVPIWGMYGSAIATALAFIAQIFYIKILLMKKINVKI